MKVRNIKDLSELKEKLKYERNVSCLILNKKKVDKILQNTHVKCWLLNVYNFPTVLHLNHYASSIVVGTEKKYSVPLIYNYLEKRRNEEKSSRKYREENNLFFNNEENSHTSDMSNISDMLDISKGEQEEDGRLILLNDIFDEMMDSLEIEGRKYFCKNEKEGSDKKGEDNEEKKKIEKNDVMISEDEISDSSVTSSGSSSSSSSRSEEKEPIETKENKSLRETLKLIITEKMKLRKVRLTFGYDNMNTAQILRTIFPEFEEIIYKFETIGHIAHLNFCEKFENEKKLIAEIILDKNKSIRTVINKKNMLNNIHRTFEIEHLAGEENYVTMLKEKDVKVKLNYQLVYWNSKLSQERSRIYHIVKNNSIVLDMFGGVGIFSLLLSRKRCVCFSNDINEHAYHYMNENIKLNKKKNIFIFNTDGRQFIKDFFVKNIHLLDTHSLTLYVDKQNMENVSIDYINMGCPDEDKKSKEKNKQEVGEDIGKDISISRKENTTDTALHKNDTNGTSDNRQNETHNVLHKIEINLYHYNDIHILMNLPADALKFLDVFKDFLNSTSQKVRNIYVYCYYFAYPAQHYEYLMKCIPLYLSKVPDDIEIHEVRAVSPSKFMYCAQFNLKSLIKTT